MNLLFYTSKRLKNDSPLKKILRKSIADKRVEVYHSLDRFVARLHEPRGHINFAILNLASSEELSIIVNLRDLLDDMRKIVILPQREKKMISDAHILAPRFLAFADDDWTILDKIIKRMLTKPASQIPPWRGSMGACAVDPRFEKPA